MLKECCSKKFTMNKDTRDSLQLTFNSHPSIDSTSVGQSSKPNVTSSSRYDALRGEKTNDGDDDNDENDGRDY